MQSRSQRPRSFCTATRIPWLPPVACFADWFCGDFCGLSCEEWKNDHDSLYQRILTKYKSSKLFWGILDDNKQDKRENPGKKTIRIVELAMSTTHTLISDTLRTRRRNSFPVSFSPSKPCLFWWLLSVNSCVLVFNPIFRWKTKK